jgi:predicted site-specific integrase-resolvase
MYDTSQLLQLFGEPNTTVSEHSHSILKPRADLQRQIDKPTEAYHISDVASGINFKKPGLRSLLEAVHLMAITTVFVASHHGKREAEGQRKRKHAKEEEAENVKKQSRVEISSCSGS